LPSTSKELLGGQDPLPELLQALGVLAHRAAHRSSGLRYGAPMIRALDPATDADACDAIVRELAEWFGVEEGVADCGRAVRTQAGLVALDEDRVIGFLTYAPSGDAWEITWMAVHPDRRRMGFGRSLISTMAAGLPPGDTIVVKTLSDRDGDPGPAYAATRRFYRALGFTPVAELDIWGPDDPCQVLARPVALS
jgi:ribosomal protein S18 acetylase RimI-like enzyme